MTTPDQPIPDLMNRTFHVVDSRLSRLSQAGKTSSGCTAVTAFLRIEQEGDAGPKGFINPGLQPRGLMEGKGEEELEAQTSLVSGSRRSSTGGGISGGGGSGSLVRKMSGNGKKLKNFMRGLTGSDKKEDDPIEDEPAYVSAEDGSKVEAIEPTSERGVKRVLYTANVGDARAVLW